MQEINELIRKYHLKPKKYTKKNNTICIETETEKYVIKENKKDNKILDYLKTRNFDYIPKIINNKYDKYKIMEYIDSIEVPAEQKIIDLIDLVSLLHYKTTHYKEITEDTYKETYEDLKNNIEYLYSYYNDLITIIETKVYMSPCEYLIARNISTIFKSISIAYEKLEEWYQIVKDKKKQRLVVLHNNLELDHFIDNGKKYLISWNKSKIGIPIFDLYKLYLKHGLEFDFQELLKRYEKNYPLLEEEKKLLFILMLLPQKINLDKTEYDNTKEVGRMVDYIYKTEMIVSPYYSNKRPKNNTDKNNN